MFLGNRQKSSKPDTGPERCIWTFSWSIYCLPHQKWSPWKGGCQDAILKEGKQGEEAELCQMTQEVDWKSEFILNIYHQPRNCLCWPVEQCAFINNIHRWAIFPLIGRKFELNICSYEVKTFSRLLLSSVTFMGTVRCRFSSHIHFSSLIRFWGGVQEQRWPRHQVQLCPERDRSHSEQQHIFKILVVVFFVFFYCFFSFYFVFQLIL